MPKGDRGGKRSGGLSFTGGVPKTIDKKASKKKEKMKAFDDYKGSYYEPRTVENVKVEYYGGFFKNSKTPNIEIELDRIKHIFRHHPDDFSRLMKNMDKTLETPDIVFINPKNAHSIVFSRKYNEKLNQLIIVYPAKEGKQRV